MNAPLLTISVVTPSYNQANYIRKTIESVIEQGLEGVEHFVIDGGSTDGTVEILKQYPHLKWVSEKDRGQSDALNKGIAQATGDVICWINSDDFVAHHAFKAIRDCFAKHPDCMLFSGNAIFVDQHDRVFQKKSSVLRRESLERPWVEGPNAFQPAVVFRRELWEEIGPIDPDLHYGMDYDFFLKASGRYPIETIDADIGCLRIYPGTKTADEFGPAFNDIKHSLMRYRKDWNPLKRAWLKLRLDLYETKVWICDAMRAEEAGRSERASLLYKKAIRANPFTLLCYPHLCYRLRQFVGLRRYEALKQRVRKLRSG